ncbi:MAG: PH domain-containing protein [Gammaproteobacteria bacterium]|nr:PH domain-containing protein [Gammaproteobacteria bacterium]MYF03194.1 PH domain-containing protein [Gammaproteobacteria bacterium]
MNEHTNDQLAVDDLPSLEDIDWVTMDRNLIVRDTMRNCLIGIFNLAVLAVVGFAMFFTIETAVYQLIGVLGICIGISLFVLLISWPRMEFPHRGYALRELDIAQKHGLVTRYLATAPFSRVQHVAVSQGVLDRMLSLATLQIYTAGGVSSIKGFHVDCAHAIREHILERVAEINLLSVEELMDEED